tara:strand:+ start:186 stop:479 length:294 start_codon:yes stop_codon:yes gene_type:complete
MDGSSLTDSQNEDCTAEGSASTQWKAIIIDKRFPFFYSEFGDLQAGEWFYHDGCLYMKVEQMKFKNAVDCGGKVKEFGMDANVELVRVELTIEHRGC